jgi:maleylpyruvate isomerase
VDSRALDDAVAGCAAAHQRLLAHLDEALESGVLDDRSVTGPSLLPGWDRAQVLAHLARNADSHRHVLAEAAAGRSAERYPGGPRQREEEIDAGRGRPAAALVADLRRSIWALEAAWAATTAEGWALTGTCMGRPERVADLPYRRWREVEVHHADLGLAGFGIADWSADYVRRELRLATMAVQSRLPMGSLGLPRAALARPEHERLAWLMGRLSIDGLDQVVPWW